MKKRFRFTIPRLELAGSRLKPGDIVEVKLTKLELINEAKTGPACA